MDSRPERVSRLVVIVAVLVTVASSWLPSIQTLADEQTNAGMKRALATFAVAKALNAGISLAQGTEIALQPAGVGLTVTLGQILDPLNDLVEQFSSLMLTACVAFGIQKVLLMIGGHWAVSLAVTFVALLWSGLHYAARSPAWLSRLLLVLVIVRFAIPVATIGSNWVFHSFLADKYERAERSLKQAAEHSSKSAVTLPEEAKEQGLWDKFKSAIANINVKGRLAELQDTVDRATDRIIDLMVVFIMQTIVVPLVLLWALFKVAGGLLQESSVARPTSTARRVVPSS